MGAFKKMRQIGRWLIILILVTGMASCGGGNDDDSIQPPEDRSDAAPVEGRQATVSLGVEGSATLGAARLDLTLPPGFSVPLDAQGNPVLETADRLPEGVLTEVSYTAPTGTAPAVLQMGIIHAEGFSPGEIAILRWPLDAGENAPNASDFSLSIEVADLDGAEYPSDSFSPSVEVQITTPSEE